ncbi:MAG: alcohol dehydrogenase catalytic domain-containing protein [Nitrospirota bacterium]|nr:MAG: alcohol dehydrogenase catalytic domain-containing protein [Nitrospirota bacterium]
MRGLVLEQGLCLQMDRPKPEPRPQEAIIRVLQAGICSTDLHIVKGYMDFQGVLGHEFVGVVDHAPDHSTLVGKRVVGEINASCCICSTCQNGRPTHCPNRTTLGIMGRDGAFADYLSLPVENLHLVPDVMTNEQAVFIEPLAAACEIPQLVAIKPTDRVIIIGDGKLGLLCAQVLFLNGCQITLLGRHTKRHGWLSQKGIAVTSEIQDLRGGADIVVEATGSPQGLTMATQLVRPRGTIVLKSTYHGQVLVNMTELVIHEISVIGSRCGPFAPALRLLAGGMIDVEPLIHRRFSLAEGIKAMEEAGQRGTLKVLLDMS